MERNRLEDKTMIATWFSAMRKSHSPQKGLILRAVLIAAAYAIADMAGLRESVSALLEGAKCGMADRVSCCTYVVLYGSLVFVAPVFLIAALLMRAWDALVRRAKSEV